MVANVIRYSKLRHLTWWLFGYAGVCISIIGVSLSRLGSSLQVVKAVYWFLCWYGYFSCYDERLVHHMCLRSTNERLLYLCQSLLSKHSLDFPFVDIQMRCPCSSSDRFLAVLLSTHIADLCCVSFPHVQILRLLVQEELELLEVATFLDRTLIVVQNYSAFLQSVFLIK